MTNIRGEVFDLWQLGEVQFLRIPFEASRHDAAFVLYAIVENITSDWRSSKCLSPYITRLILSGRSVPDDIHVHVGGPGRVEVRINGSLVQLDSNRRRVGELFGQPIVLRKPSAANELARRSVRSGIAAEFLLGYASTIQISAGKRHLNVVAGGLLSFKRHVGGLLGQDDHEQAARRPSSCSRKDKWKFASRKRKARRNSGKERWKFASRKHKAYSLRRKRMPIFLDTVSYSV